MSIFNNESILAWLKYFSDHSEIDLSTVRILDITGENRNLLPTVQANRSVLVFTDGNHPEIFYSMWDEGMGDCEIWYNEGSEPQGPMKHNLLSEMIDRGVNVSAAMLINNPRAHSGYRPGQRQLFSRHHPVRGAGDSGGHSEKALPGREGDHLLCLRGEHRRGSGHRRPPGPCGGGGV